MAIVEKMVMTSVQIQLFDYNWTLVTNCLNHENHVLI
jgi:hypothetical protein